jgi:DNA-binding GntR family transcriptional regulator
LPSAIEIKSVTESVFQHLRVQIITGHLPPGHKLSETELSSDYGVSRQPLREAFRLLEGERLVVSIPRKGCYVAAISLEDCREICEVWEMIEAFSIDLLRSKRIKHLPEAGTALKEATDLLPTPIPDPFLYFEHLKTVSGFHVKLVEATRNTTLIHLYKSILSNLARYQALFISDKAVNEHKAILALIQGGKYQKAKELLRAHIKTLRDNIETKLESELKSGR